MFCLFYCFIQLSADRKTANMAMPVHQFPITINILLYHVLYMNQKLSYLKNNNDNT